MCIVKCAKGNMQSAMCIVQTWKKFQSFRKHVLSTTDISAYAFLKIIVEMKSSFIGYKYNKYLIFKRNFYYSTVSFQNKSNQSSTIQIFPQFSKTFANNVRVSASFSMSANMICQKWDSSLENVCRYEGGGHSTWLHHANRIICFCVFHGYWKTAIVLKGTFNM